MKRIKGGPCWPLTSTRGGHCQVIFPLLNLLCSHQITYRHRHTPQALPPPPPPPPEATPSPHGQMGTMDGRPQRANACNGRAGAMNGRA